MGKNFIFVSIWIIIMIGQIIITSFGQRVFVCCLDGLDGIQWAMAIGVGLTSLIINFLLKLIPIALPVFLKSAKTPFMTHGLKTAALKLVSDLKKKKKKKKKKNYSGLIPL